MTTKTEISRIIRKHCNECYGRSHSVDECRGSPVCSLHKYRLGVCRGTTKTELLKTIRQHCLLCGGSPKEVSHCSSLVTPAEIKCVLHPFRFGKDPNPNIGNQKRGTHLNDFYGRN
ncbi:hypothetical protein SAMN04488589_1740 [Methanolobus vulcani]|uniref:Uncharacterized protein n=1 Tax=Methanolobus vulcani TaxID=38026 RepID=A0A7Z7FCR1_9EURY|nr:hypothetical protein SAMN04488589_1740 [Methanolobus vulcani]